MKPHLKPLIRIGSTCTRNFEDQSTIAHGPSGVVLAARTCNYVLLPQLNGSHFFKESNPLHELYFQILPTPAHILFAGSCVIQLLNITLQSHQLGQHHSFMEWHKNRSWSWSFALERERERVQEENILITVVKLPYKMGSMSHTPIQCREGLEQTHLVQSLSCLLVSPSGATLDSTLESI